MIAPRTLPRPQLIRRVVNVVTVIAAPLVNVITTMFVWLPLRALALWKFRVNKGAAYPSFKETSCVRLSGDEGGQRKTYWIDGAHLECLTFPARVATSARVLVVIPGAMCVACRRDSWQCFPKPRGFAVAA